jgi:hypothetical protein
MWKNLYVSEDSEDFKPPAKPAANAGARPARGSSPLVSGGVTDDEYSKNTLTQRRKGGV